jgi:predicted negative regulator of RcsB-dependent stress response
MYWQLPVFALGVTAAVLAWRYFPQTGLADGRNVEQDRYTLRQSVSRRPVNIAEIQSLLTRLGDDGTRADGNPEVAFVQGSAYLLMAEQGPPEQTAENWKRAHALFAECDGSKLADKNDRARLAFRAAKATAGAGLGEPAALLPQLEVVPPGEDAGERGRLLAETYLRQNPPNTKMAKKELAGYLSGPPRGTPEQAAKLKLMLADLCATTGEPDKARTWLKEVGDPVPVGLQAEAKLRLARLALNDGDVNEAVKLYQSAEALPNLPPAVQTVVRYETGRGLILLNNPAAARDSLTKAAESPSPVGLAAHVRLAELSAKEFDPTGGVANLEAALKGVKNAGEWANPHVPIGELRTACEGLIAACKSAGKHASAARTADVYSAVAENARDRELWAEVMHAWGNTPGLADAADKLKAAAGEWVKLADARPEAEKSALLQKAAAAYQSAGDTVKATAVLNELSTSTGASPDVQAAAQFQRAEALIAENKMDDGVKLLGEVANGGGPVGTKATLRLALVFAQEGKRGLAAKPTDAAAKKQVEYAVTLLTQLANKTYPTADERQCHQQALYELGKMQLSTPAVYNCSDAEMRLRRLVTEYPTGDYADRGTLFLAIALNLLAQGAGGNPPADADRKFAEARKLFESLHSSKDDYYRTQADIRLAHTLFHMKDYDTLTADGPKLADRYKGRVEELIILNFVFSAHTATKRADRARQVLDRMEAAYSTLTDAKYTGEMPELTKPYWAEQFEKLRKRLNEK